MGGFKLGHDDEGNTAGRANFYHIRYELILVFCCEVSDGIQGFTEVRFPVRRCFDFFRGFLGDPKPYGRSLGGFCKPGTLSEGRGFLLNVFIPGIGI